MDLKQLSNKNKGLKELYAEISSWRKIISEKGSGAEWGSYINDNGDAVIIYTKTKNKSSVI